jgi:hypothetical protein
MKHQSGLAHEIECVSNMLPNLAEAVQGQQQQLTQQQTIQDCFNTTTADELQTMKALQLQQTKIIKTLDERINMLSSKYDTPSSLAKVRKKSQTTNTPTDIKATPITMQLDDQLATQYNIHNQYH